MRTDQEILRAFREFEENNSAYQRERLTLEVMLDLRNLLSELVKLEKEYDSNANL